MRPACDTSVVSNYRTDIMLDNKNVSSMLTLEQTANEPASDGTLAKQWLTCTRAGARTRERPTHNRCTTTRVEFLKAPLVKNTTSVARIATPTACDPCDCWYCCGRVPKPAVVGSPRALLVQAVKKLTAPFPKHKNPIVQALFGQYTGQQNGCVHRWDSKQLQL